MKEGLAAMFMLISPFAAWVLVSRVALKIYRASGWPKLTTWLCSVVAGFLAGLSILMFFVWMTTQSANADMFWAFAMSACLAAMMVYLGKKSPPKQTTSEQLLSLWQQARQKMRAAWEEAEREVEAKRAAHVVAAPKPGTDVVMFDYVDADGVWTERTVVDPHGYTDGGRHYVQAYCLDKSDVRTFRLDRIKGKVRVMASGEALSARTFFEGLPYPGRASAQ